MAGTVPALTPEEAKRFLHNPISAHARGLHAVLAGRGGAGSGSGAGSGLREPGEVDVFYAVRLRQVLAELVAAPPDEHCAKVGGKWRHQRAVAFQFRPPAGGQEAEEQQQQAGKPEQEEEAWAPSKLAYAAAYATALRLGGVPARLLFGTHSGLAADSAGGESSGAAAAAAGSEDAAAVERSVHAATWTALHQNGPNHLGLPPDCQVVRARVVLRAGRRLHQRGRVGPDRERG